LQSSAFHRPRWRLPFVSLLAAICLALVPAGSSAAPISKNVSLLAHFNTYSRYSACWSYVHHDGREYAVLGTETGTSIVNVTNPAAAYEVAFIPGLTSIWREMKQYRTWLYVSTEALGGGLQIIRMTDPEHPVLAGTYTTTFNAGHTVTVDTTRALIIVNGTRMNGAPTGMRILSVANPESPVDIGGYTADYVHDSWMRGTTLYASSIVTGIMRVFDTSTPATPNQIVSWTYSGAKTHSGETSKDGRYLYVCDEINYSTLKVFDMLDPQAHPLIYETTVNPLSIVHNVHVKRDTAFVAWYTEGSDSSTSPTRRCRRSGVTTTRTPPSRAATTASGRSRPTSRPGPSSRATSSRASTSSVGTPTTASPGCASCSRAAPPSSART